MSQHVIATKHPEGHKKGSIVRIKMKNFLTYTQGEIYPGPKLNVIMGPNGSGKSTVVCAIALGLGATAKLLERGDNICDYVMRDKNEGFIEIELKDGNRNKIIRRDFEKATRKSTWKLNGQNVTQAKIKELVEDYFGIQVDNLCTFLPQEKVGLFTTLNPQQLLVETEKAMARSKLHAQHEELMSLQSRMKDRSQEKDALQKSLVELEEQNKVLERDKKRMEERQAHLDKAEKLKKAQMWVEFERKKAIWMQLKEERKEVLRKRQVAEASLRPYTEKVKELQTQMEQAKTTMNKIKKAEEKSAVAVEKALQRCQECDDAVTEARQEQGKFQNQRANVERELQRKRQELIHKRKELASLKPDEIKERISKLKAIEREKYAKKDEYMGRLDEKQQQQEGLRRKYESSKRELANLQNQSMAQKRRFQEYVHGAQGALQALKWIESERNLFRGRVYGPMGLEIRVSDERNAAAIVEDVIGISNLTTFVVDNKEDLKLFFDKRREMEWNFSIISIAGRGNEHERRKYGQGDMEMLKREADIRGYADALMVCSEPIKRALYIQTSLFECMVGTDKTEQRLTHDADFFGTLLGGGRDEGGGAKSAIAYTEANINGRHVVFRYNTSRSRYDSTVSSTLKEVGPPKIFCASQDPERLMALEKAVADQEQELAQVTAAVHELHKESGKCEAEYRQTNHDIQELRKRLHSESSLKNTIHRLEDAIQKLEHKLSQDEAGERERLERHLRTTVCKMVEQTQRYIDLVVEKVDVPLKSVVPRLEHENFKVVHQDATRALRAKDLECQELVEACEEIEAKYRNARQEATDLMKRCQEEAAIEEGHENFDPVVRDLLLGELYEKTVEEIQVLIDDEEAAAASIAHNPQVIKLYEQRKREIEAKSKELEELLKNVESGQERIETIKAQWIAKLQNLTDKVHARFSHYMKQMEVEGAVKLATDGDNFKNYGLEISVSFRKSQKMSILSAVVQSGGERSVSTILYLMALQDQMQSPFRCVDEINQGMDERNERLIFSRIVANTAGPDEPQYFLITPKLLSSLTAMESPHVMVHVVFNGPGVCNYKSWDMDKFLDRQHQVTEGEEGSGGGGAASSSSGRGKRGRSHVRVVDDDEEAGGEHEDGEEEEEEFLFSQARQTKRGRKSRQG